MSTIPSPTPSRALPATRPAIPPLAPRRALPLALLAAALLLAAGWPYLVTLGYWPMAADSPAWFERCDPRSPGWAGWIFGGHHFNVGYRPVAGLTFALGQWVAGPVPWIARGTDVALHLGAALALAWLCRAIAPELPRAAAWLAAGLYLVHPALEEVVPISGRRSYSLASLLALVGLAVACRAARLGDPPRVAPRLGWSLASGAALAAALLSNEVAVLAVAILPALVFACERPGRGRLARAAAGCAGVAVLVAAALALRTAVIGGLGGYDVDEEARGSFAAIFGAAWRRLAAVGIGRRGDWLAVDGPFAVWAVAAAAGHAAAAVAVARAGGGRRWLGIAGALALWTTAYFALFAVLGVLYPRQVGAAVPAWALLGAVQIGAVGTHLRGGLRAALLAILFALQAGAVSASPLLVGPDAGRMEKWSSRQGLIEALLAAARSAERPALLKLVLTTPERQERGPNEMHALERQRRLSRDTRAPVRWVEYLLRDEEVELEEVAYVVEAGWSWDAGPELLAAGRDLAVRVPPGRDVLPVAGRIPRAPDDPDVLLLGLRPEDLDRHVYVFLYRAGGGVLEKVH